MSTIRANYILDAAGTGAPTLTNGAVLPAGSAAAPAISPTGDSNTGVFFPAADTVALTTGGSERLRVDSSGNVGIGTTSPAAKLEITNATAPDFRLTVGSTLTTNFYASSGGTALYTVPALPLIFGTNNTERMRIDSSGNLLFNSGYGSVATAYGCRAWVNFNGTGTVAIRASGNVSSITDGGTGVYTINFTTAMSDADYATIVSGGGVGDDVVGAIPRTSTTPTTSAITIAMRRAGSIVDIPYVNAAVFR